MWNPQTLAVLNEKFEEKLKREAEEGEAEFEETEGAPL